MTTPPILTDRNQLDLQRKRAARSPALFLQEASADETQQRLDEVNKSFTSPAIVSPWPAVWEPILPKAVIVPDTDVLALEPGAHDLVIHALSLHWANDPVGQLVQCRRALRPDGLLIATLFGGETLTELRQALAQVEAKVTGGLSPRIAPMGEIRDLGGLLGRAGFAMPVADVTRLTVSYASATALMRDLRFMGEGNALAARRKHPVTRPFIDLTDQTYRDMHSTADGRISATFDIVTLTGWAPASSHPKPLRPGSAKTRLADALGTEEFNPNKSKD